MIRDKEGNLLQPFELKHRQVEALEKIGESLHVLASLERKRTRVTEQKVAYLERLYEKAVKEKKWILVDEIYDKLKASCKELEGENESGKM